MDESNDSENSNYLTAAVIQAATVTNVPRLKLLLERHPDLVNSVEPVSGNSLLHLAVLHGGYNSAVHLLITESRLQHPSSEWPRPDRRTAGAAAAGTRRLCCCHSADGAETAGVSAGSAEKSVIVRGDVTSASSER